MLAYQEKYSMRLGNDFFKKNVKESEDFWNGLFIFKYFCWNKMSNRVKSPPLPLFLENQTNQSNL